MKLDPEGELKTAKSVQGAILKPAVPYFSKLEVLPYCEHARDIGGDFYEIVSLADDKALIFIGDVMGSGVPAALVATTVVGKIRELCMMEQDPSKVLARLNESVVKEMGDMTMFVTVQAVSIDVGRSCLYASNAGHCSPYLLLPGRERPLQLALNGMPLGIMRNVSYDLLKLELPHEFKLFQYTDGVTELSDGGYRFLGQGELEAKLTQALEESFSNEQLKEAILAAMRDFEGNRRPEDDRAFLISGSRDGEPTTKER